MQIGAHSGFTLVEVIIVMAVIGILAAVTAPSIGKMIGGGQSRALARGFANQLRLARNQASMTNQVFIVKTAVNGGVINGQTTERGQVSVFASVDANSICREIPTAKPQPISEFRGESVGGTAVLFSDSGSAGSLEFCVQPNGQILSMNGTPLAGNSGLCDGEAVVLAVMENGGGVNVASPHACESTNASKEARALADYWRVSLWDNGLVTVRR